MKNNSAEVCRDIIDTSSVIQDQATVALIENLMSTGKINLKDCEEVSSILKKSIGQQMSNLVDRVIVSYDAAESQKTVTKKTTSRSSKSS